MRTSKQNLPAAGNGAVDRAASRRDQRRWVDASSKHENKYFGFGTGNDLEQSPGYVIIKHDTLPRVALPPARRPRGHVRSTLRRGDRRRPPTSPCAPPGVGGILPAAKISPEIAATRGVPIRAIMRGKREL